MRFIIRTYTAPGGGEPMKLVKEKKCGSLVECLKIWMEAMMDFTIDRIQVEVDKA